MKSLWSETVQFQEREALVADLRAKNVVIGAGMAGLLIAYLLQEKGEEVIILEANQIASGQTKNTTAKITSQHGSIYQEMITKTDEERARGYAQANENAIGEYERIITKEGIQCHFQRLPSFLYSVREDGIKILKREAVAAKALGIAAEYVSGEQIRELPFSVMGAVRFDNQAQFHPLEFIEGIIEKLTIYEHTKVLEVDEHFVITNHGVVVADNVIFATHYPFPIVPGYYFLRQHQSRSYVIALEGNDIPEKLSGMYYGIDREGLSFRCANGRLVLGGGSHRTGKAGNAKAGICYLRTQAKMYYPNSKEIAHWAAQDCMPHDKIPFIGRFSAKREHWYVATGFQKWGMSTAMVAAMVISDMIAQRENPYIHVFTPQRLLWKAGIKGLLLDLWESFKGLVKGAFVTKKKRCPHMGCALSWNKQEQTWDCSCHGSRFEKDGTIIDNPAQSNKTHIEK